MKKIFWVGCVLAGVALFASCRGESGKTVEGTPIGQGLIIKKTEARKLQLCDSLGSSLAIEDYDEIDGNAFFIIARTGDNIALYRNNGQSLTRCDSFAIHRYYPVTADERERRYLETIVDGAHRAFDLDSLTIRSATEGVKDGIWPMACGYSITKQNKLYQLDETGKDEPIMPGCQEMHIINHKGKIILLVKTDDFSGYCSVDGQGIKRLSRAGFVSAKKAGTVLWSAEDGKISAIVKEKI